MIVSSHRTLLNVIHDKRLCGDVYRKLGDITALLNILYYVLFIILCTVCKIIILFISHIELGNIYIYIYIYNIVIIFFVYVNFPL